MENKELLAPELEAMIAEALESFDRAAIEARINDDPLRFIMLALAGFLKSQRRLYLDGALTLRRELREARGTIINREDVERGVLRGVSAHMRSLVRLMTWRTWMAGAAALFAVFMAGSVSGYLFHGAAPILAGVRDGPEQCKDGADGSRLCWIPVWERPPPTK
jgi:hypothetical protein